MSFSWNYAWRYSCEEGVEHVGPFSVTSYLNLFNVTCPQYEDCVEKLRVSGITALSALDFLRLYIAPFHLRHVGFFYFFNWWKLCWCFLFLLSCLWLVFHISCYLCMWMFIQAAELAQMVNWKWEIAPQITNGTSADNDLGWRKA